MATHGRALLRVANRWSLCHDDAMDAYQRALEIFLRRIDAVDPATEVAWLRVVVKHEALAIRRARSASVSGEDVDVDRVVPSAARSVEERLAGEERVKRSAEALRALKPDEARALMLKAEGLSYAEIGERCGWSYTKVNRSITEGRRRFLEVFRAIEAGDACERYAGTLAALAGGTATSAEIIEIRPHLRHCMACRATVRQLHKSRLSGLQLLVPGWVFGLLAWRGGALDHADRLKPAEEILHEAPVLHVPTPSPTPDPVSVLDPDALAHAIESGGQVVVRAPRLARLRDEVFGFLGRSQASDVATGVQLAATGGGGRIATIATVIGFCVSGAGAGALCVATGVVEAPRWIFHDEPRAAAPPRKAPAAATAAAASRADGPRTKRVAELVRTPAPTSTPAPRRRVAGGRPLSRRSSSVDPSQGTAPDSHESPPIADASRSTTRDFSIEQSNSAASTADPAPPTGGGEFTP